MKRLLLLVLIAGCFGACKKKNADNQATVDDKIIQQYISDHKLNATKTSDGLYYSILVQGTGAQPNINSQVTVEYDGFLSDGTLFDQSPSTGTTFALNSVIKGWQEGIPFFKKGGKGTILVPSALGYGQNANGNIPANSVLIFNIQLLNVQ